MGAHPSLESRVLYARSGGSPETKKAGPAERKPKKTFPGGSRPVRGWRSPYHNELTTLMSFFAYPTYQFGSGRGTLFVPEMDEEAFPPLRPVGGWVRGARRFVQMLLGLRHGRA